MDIRIVNTCNNNCLFCLEQVYRRKEPFVESLKIFEDIKLLANSGEKNLTFYGGNPLLHPELLRIIQYAKSYEFEDISILSNSGTLNEVYLNELISSGLSTFGIYFNSFSEKSHQILNQGGIPFDKLIKNIKLLSQSKIYFKMIIHINNINIGRLFRDLEILNNHFSIGSFEFINYFPFDRPYEKYRDILSYDVGDKRESIDKLFQTLEKNECTFLFHKMSRDFFGKYEKYYDKNSSVIQHISKEDTERISQDSPHCLREKRCPDCFIKDDCVHYDRIA